MWFLNGGRNFSDFCSVNFGSRNIRNDSVFSHLTLLSSVLTHAEQLSLNYWNEQIPTITFLKGFSNNVNGNPRKSMFFFKLVFSLCKRALWRLMHYHALRESPLICTRDFLYAGESNKKSISIVLLSKVVSNCYKLKRFPFIDILFLAEVQVPRFDLHNWGPYGFVNRCWI